jgi:hypothetical protein
MPHISDMEQYKEYFLFAVTWVLGQKINESYMAESVLLLYIFMYILKRLGDRTEPCASPSCISLGVDI